jgi:hypothetical protein
VDLPDQRDQPVKPVLLEQQASSEQRDQPVKPVLQVVSDPQVKPVQMVPWVKPVQLEQMVQSVLLEILEHRVQPE